MCPLRGGLVDILISVYGRPNITCSTQRTQLRLESHFALLAQATHQSISSVAYIHSTLLLLQRFHPPSRLVGSVEVGPLAVDGLIFEVLPAKYSLVSLDNLPPKSKCWVTYTLAFSIVSMRLSSPSATWMTSSIKPAPILCSSSEILPRGN